MLLADEMVARSSLERMLDSIRVRDEQPKTKGTPPALPARPTSIGRLPSLRRPLHFQLTTNGKKREDEVEFVLKREIFGGRMLVKLEETEETTYDKMPELVSYEERMDEAEDLGSAADHSLPAISSDEEQEWIDTSDSVLRKIVAVDDALNRRLQRINWVQAKFRGFQAHRNFQEFKKGVITLQSFIRGENARNEFRIQGNARQHIAWKPFHDEQKNVIHLQSVIRGWLARRHLMIQKSWEMTKIGHMKLDSDQGILQKIKDTSEDRLTLRPSVVIELRRRVLQAEAAVKQKEAENIMLQLKLQEYELQRRVLQAEAAVKQKEEENIMLQLKLQEYETRWSEYETKMESMEKILGERLISLQMSLSEEGKNLSSQSGGHDSSSDHLFDSEETMTTGTCSPESKTQTKQPHDDSDTGQLSNSEGAKNSVRCLEKEFDQWTHIFEDDAKSLTEKMNSGKLSSIKRPQKELQKLKAGFTAWKKEFNVRLREAKVALRKPGNPRSEKHRRIWNKKWSLGCVK